MRTRCLYLLIALILILSQVTPVNASSDPADALVDQPGGSLAFTQIQGGILFEAYTYPYNHVTRYDTRTQTWLPEWGFFKMPTALYATSNELYIAFENVLTRSNLDGSNRVTLYTEPGKDSYGKPFMLIHSIQVADGLIFLSLNDNSYGINERITTLSQVTGQVIETKSGPFETLVVAPGLNKIFTSYTTGDTTLLVQLSYTADGHLGEPVCGPMLPEMWGEFLILFPDETRLIDRNGDIYATTDLSYQNALPGPISAVVFTSSGIITLRGDTLYLYNAQYQETAQFTPAFTSDRLFLDGQILYASGNNGSARVVQAVPFSDFQPAALGPAVEPLGLHYIPSQIFMDQDETVYLLDPNIRAIFRWSAVQHGYLPTLPLTYHVAFMAYDATSRRLYLAYQNSRLGYMDLSLTAPVETAFGELPAPPCGLAAADGFLVTCAATASSNTYATYSPAGKAVSSAKMVGGSAELAWDPFNRRIFALSSAPYNANNSTTASLPLAWFNLDAQGQITNPHSDPASPDYQPLRVSEDGSTYLFGSGRTRSASNLAVLRNYSRIVKDGLWYNGALYLVPISGQVSSTIEKYSAGGYISQQLNSENIQRVFSVKAGLLVISNFITHPAFQIMDESLTTLLSSPRLNIHLNALIGSFPQTVTFDNYSYNDNPANTYLWNFGDGSTSAEMGRTITHTYTQAGRYTVSLSASGPGGEDRITISSPIPVRQPAVFLPLISNKVPAYPYQNACETFSINRTASTMTECVPSISVLSNGTIRVNFTWTPDLYTSYVSKSSDLYNPNMYLTDQSGQVYYMFGAGGAALYHTYMNTDQTYAGWFNFPASNIPAPVYTFHDDDNHIQIGPLAVPR